MRETCDVVISNVVVIDATRRIGKVSIGIRDGRISGVGRAGNPDTLDDVDVVESAVSADLDVLELQPAASTTSAAAAEISTRWGEVRTMRRHCTSPATPRRANAGTHAGRRTAQW